MRKLIFIACITMLLASCGEPNESDTKSKAKRVSSQLIFETKHCRWYDLEIENEYYRSVSGLVAVGDL